MIIMGKSDATNELKNFQGDFLCPAKSQPTDIPRMDRNFMEYEILNEIFSSFRWTRNGLFAVRLFIFIYIALAHSPFLLSLSFSFSNLHIKIE